MAILFHEAVPVVLKRRRALKAFLLYVFQSKGKTLSSLNIIFCSDDYLKTINEQFLNHDFFTDIITFDLSITPSGPIEGEIYISVDRVKDNAKSFKSDPGRELHRVIFHGVLHLCGYGDKSLTDKVIMTREEDACLAAYF